MTFDQPTDDRRDALPSREEQAEAEREAREVETCPEGCFEPEVTVLDYDLRIVRCESCGFVFIL